MSSIYFWDHDWKGIKLGKYVSGTICSIQPLPSTHSDSCYSYFWGLIWWSLKEVSSQVRWAARLNLTYLHRQTFSLHLLALWSSAQIQLHLHYTNCIFQGTSWKWSFSSFDYLWLWRNSVELRTVSTMRSLVLSSRLLWCIVASPNANHMQYFQDRPLIFRLNQWMNCQI